MLRLAVTFALLVSTAAATASAQRSIDWTQVDHAMGKTGAMQPSDVYRYAFPRSDLHVTVDGVPLKPALALGGWVAFKATGDNEAVAMGDLVLRDDEVNPVMLTLREGGVEQTALHNHLLRESPTIMYMHIHAQGDPTHIASTIHAALALTATPFTAPPPPAATPGPAPLDTTAIATALGRSGKLNGTVYQVTVPRSESIQMDGMTVPPAMGVATGINIQAVTSDKAVTTGDFVLTAAEVNPVIQALTEHGIAVTAVHSHMLTEEPRLFFMHFWGNADAVTLARGLRAALDKTNRKGS